MKAITAATLLLMLSITVPTIFFGSLIYHQEDVFHQINWVSNPTDNKILDAKIALFCFSIPFTEWEKAHVVGYNGTFSDAITIVKIHYINDIEDFISIANFCNITLIQRDAFSCQNNVVYFFYYKSHCFAYYLF